MDAETGEVIFAQSPDSTRQPASTIKVLTGLIAIDSLKDQDRVRASQHAAAMPRSKIYLKPGKTYAADDMINAVLLASANDASVALAERIGGSERAFAKLMTAKAEALGARKTVCKTANGLTAPGQHSTARDLAVIFNGAMKNPDFARRMSLRKVETNYGGTLHSHNRALWQVHGAEGGKTGFTNVARKTYVGKFSRGNDQIVVALMGSENMWTDVRRLVEYGFGKKNKTNQSLASATRSSQPVYKARRIEEEALSALTILADSKKVSPM
jgi:D-alanyl-D-alanine carboxypeptidase (penicillin-binding protein 5/6)